MAKQEYAEWDSNILRNVKMSLVGPAVDGGEREIKFQFPPRVMKDGKTASWDEIYQGTFEPFPVYKGSDARLITVQWEYIVDGDPWTVTRVMEEIRQAKAYFYISMAEAQDKFPIINLKLYEYSPSGGTWRGISVNVTPSGPLVGTGSGATVCHLKHQVSIDMKLITTAQLNPKPGDGSQIQASNLLGSPKSKWF